MAYDFDVVKFIPNFLLPKEEPPVQPLQLLPVQTPPPEQPALQEQVDGKNLVNSAIAAAIPKAPNPYQLEIQRGLLAQKQAFNDAKTAEQRAAAQTQANYLRDVANAAGIDVSGYGADVSLADAYKNLDSQRARDIMAAMQGYYSRNSEQYYNDEYFRGIERGLSPRKAQKVAEALTGDYQAERVNYLDGLLNSYGRDGLVVNDYGNSAIADLISEDPQRASFYATIYPNAKEAYATAADVAKNATEYGYRIGLLQEGGNQTRLSQNNAAGHNQELAKLNAILSRGTHAANAAVDFNYDQAGKDSDAIRKSEEREEIDALNWKNAYRGAEFERQQNKIKQAEEDRRKAMEREQQTAYYYGWADRFGYKGVERDRFVAQRLGVLTKEDREADAGITKKAKDWINNLAKRQENYYKVLTSENASDEDKVTAREELNIINKQMQELDVMFGDELGTMGSMNVTPYTGDESVDSQTLRTILGHIASKSNGNVPPDVALKATREWLEDSGEDFTDDEIKAFIEKSLAR